MPYVSCVIQFGVEVAMERDVRELCEQPGDGDGIDLRFDLKEGGRKDRRKALQLCAQVERALMLGLSECQDQCLQNLQVVGVEPAPYTTRLLVRLEGAEADAEVRQALACCKGALRTLVAQEITRKKAPDLVFDYRRL
jgi:ribosome-binding factor A